MSAVAALGGSVTHLAALSWNPLADVGDLLHYPFMQHAFEAGTFVALVAGAVGYFIVIRASSFAAHALSHIGFAGAAGAVAAGVNPLWGLLAFTVLGGAAMGGLGNRLQGRDATIGTVLAWMLGLGVLFLSLYTGYATQAYAILFGEVLGISARDVVYTAALGTIVLAVLAAVYRPLLFASIDEDVAAARGVPVRSLSAGFLVIVAVAVAESVQVVGVLLIFALLVTPGAIASRLVRRPSRALPLSAGLALAFTWAGLVLAYYQPYPASFFITSIAFLSFLLARAIPVLAQRWRSNRRAPEALRARAE